MMDDAGSSDVTRNDARTHGATDTRLTQPRSRDVHGYVYFLRSGEAIKIGFSIHPIKRVDELQIGNPEELELLGAAEGTERDEKALHADFSHLEIRSEWFRAEQELLDFIEEVSGRSVELRLRPRASPETMTVIKKLMVRRAACGMNTPIGHRYSNLIEQTRNYEHAEGNRAALAGFIAKSVAEIQQLNSQLPP